MRGSPEFLTCDLSENRSKALPPSLLPRIRIELESMLDSNLSVVANFGCSVAVRLFHPTV